MPINNLTNTLERLFQRPWNALDAGYLVSLQVGLVGTHTINVEQLLSSGIDDLTIDTKEPLIPARIGTLPWSEERRKSIT